MLVSLSPMKIARTLLLTTLVALAAPIHAAGKNPSADTDNQCCGKITPEGHRLAAAIDSFDVEHHWLSGTRIEWLSGDPLPNKPKGTTHCSAYAAAAAYRLQIYLLRPPDHGQYRLSNAQGHWLDSDEGRKAGWKAISTPAEAQTLTNQGWLVLVTYINPNEADPGHLAVLRPAEKTEAQLAEEGPQVSQSGWTNRNNSVAAKSFTRHPGAWPNNVRYYAHAVDWANIHP